MTRKAFYLLVALFLLSHSGFAKSKTHPGETIYKKYCLSCHGAKGKGDGPAGKALKPKPRDFTKGKFKYGCSPKALFKIVSNGVPKTAMPSWKKTLKASQIKNVVDYILKKFVPKKIQQKCLKKKKKS